MIDRYYWPRPNGWKISIMLEECSLPYTLKPVNIGRGEQFSPAFLRLSPNNRMPAIVDHDPPGGGDPVAIFESAAILQYLAEKAGRFLPRDVRGRYEVLQWVAGQVANLGPGAGPLDHLGNHAPEEGESHSASRRPRARALTLRAAEPRGRWSGGIGAAQRAERASSGRAPRQARGGRARERSRWPTGSGGIGAAQRAERASSGRA